MTVLLPFLGVGASATVVRSCRREAVILSAAQARGVP